MKNLIYLSLFISPLLSAQTSTEQKYAWGGLAMAWNIPQDLFGGEIKTTFEGKVKEEKYWNNYFSISVDYGRKLFESSIFHDLPPDRIESAASLNLLFGKGHHFNNSILIFKAGMTLNYAAWRGEQTGSTCNSFFCLGKYHTFAYKDIFEPGLDFEVENVWVLAKHLGMGISLFTQIHPSYGIINSPFNNNYMEGGLSFFLVQLGRLEN